MARGCPVCAPSADTALGANRTVCTYFLNLIIGGRVPSGPVATRCSVNHTLSDQLRLLTNFLTFQFSTSFTVNEICALGLIYLPEISHFLHLLITLHEVLAHCLLYQSRSIVFRPKPGLRVVRPRTKIHAVTLDLRDGTEGLRSNCYVTAGSY